jgi:hypothetical protein
MLTPCVKSISDDYDFVQIYDDKRELDSECFNDGVGDDLLSFWNKIRLIARFTIRSVM